MTMAYEELTGKIIGAAIEVHRSLGPGFLESVYHQAMVMELKKKGIKVQSEFEVPIYYDGLEVGKHRLDLLVEDTVIVELKAVKTFEPVHFAIVKSYLKAANKEHGLLINFSNIKIEARRVTK